ncbi:MAG: phage holin family protein [Chloroflexi bacterium]|nr:phage holin family protein [Chloroflexota bacterium]
MTRLIIRWLINAAALWAAAALVSGIGYEGWPALLIVALIFGLVNALIRPILKLLTCPLQVLTLGLFTIVINALMLLLTSWLADQFNIAFWVSGFWPDAVLGALVVSVVSIVLSIFLKDRDEERRKRRS